MTNMNKALVIIAIVMLVALSIGIAGNAAANAKRTQRAKDVVNGNKGEFNPRPYTDSLFGDCYNNSYCDTTLYADLVKMSDDNIRAIFMDWANRYQGKKENENRTLGNALKYAYSGWLQWNWSSSVEPFYNRLKQLGLE